jgi:hypothetical protein
VPISCLIWRIAERWLYELGLTIDHLRLYAVKFNIEKSDCKCRKEKVKRQQALTQQINAASNIGGKNKKKKGRS